MAKRSVLLAVGVLVASSAAIVPTTAAGAVPLTGPLRLPSTLNLAGAGDVPATLFGTAAVNAAALDPATVRLGDGARHDVAVARRADGSALAFVQDVNGDGRADLVVHFDKQQLVRTGALTPSTSRLILSADQPNGPAVSGTGTVTPDVALEVKFAAGLQVRGANTQLHSATGASLQRVQDVLDRNGARDVEPLVQGISASALTALAVTAGARSGRAAPDMASWYSVTLPADVDPDAVIGQLHALPDVAFAYPAPDPVPPPDSSTPDFTTQQGYLRPAPEGIDADFAHQDVRARGAGVQIADLEYDWDFNHEDLQVGASSDLGGTVYPRYTAFMDEHGTAVFGELVAHDNGYGVTGAVPDASMYGISPTNSRGSWQPGPALAYLAGLGVLKAGDAVLLEQQTVGPAGGTNYAPLEWIPSVWDAVRLLTDLGVVVVETGGNGNQNVDDPSYVRNGVKWFDRSVHDSGAILVGAGSGTDHERLGFSNYGSRFDLQGWGGSIVTTGFNGNLWGGTDPANRDMRYTNSFGGTSGAGPIVTGAVVAVQSYLEATGQKPWTAEQIASVLAATGTPQGPTTAGQHIGPLPNLQAALKSIEVDPPTTTITLTQKPPRQGDWYINPRVTLTAGDGWGSGVAQTAYRLDGGGWTTYRAPFRVLGPGEHTVNYRSLDGNGNLEPTRSLTFRNLPEDS
jgi:subtilase family protein